MVLYDQVIYASFASIRAKEKGNKEKEKKKLKGLRFGSSLLPFVKFCHDFSAEFVINLKHLKLYLCFGDETNGFSEKERSSYIFRKKRKLEKDFF